MQRKPFLTPADVAAELDISTSTVMRKIHAGEIPAIAVSERIYRVPAASFEMFVTGRLRIPEPAPIGGRRARPRIGSGEPKPTRSRAEIPVRT
jgi:excisionase family DNA binding protein